jgi:hypothetical protein
MKEELRKFWEYLLSEGMLTGSLDEESFEQWVYDNYIRDMNVSEN